MEFLYWSPNSTSRKKSSQMIELYLFDSSLANCNKKLFDYFGGKTEKAANLEDGETN